MVCTSLKSFEGGARYLEEGEEKGGWDLQFCWKFSFL